MPKHDDSVRLRHMLEAARKAMAFARGKSRADLDRDEQLALALVRLLEVIGEAAKGISDTTRQRALEVSWKEITGTRDRLIHGYFDVDLDVIWQIVTGDLPRLVGQLQQIVPPER